MGGEGALQSQFYTDAAEQLGEAEELVLYLEHNGYEEETLHSLFRLFHTLKGNSNMVGEGEISNLTHALESRLDEVRKGTQPLSDELIQSTFEAIDLLNMACQEEDSGPYAGQLRQMTAALSAEKGGAPEGAGEAGEAEEARRSSAGDRETDGKGSGSSRLRGGGSPRTARRKAAAERSAGEAAAGGSSAEREVPPIALGEVAPAEPQDFERWRPLLRRYYRVWELADSLRTGEGDFEDLLMELGMESIELRSAASEFGSSVERLCAYLEKFTATLTREQIPYNGISYELLFLLLEDLEGLLIRGLQDAGALREFVAGSLGELEELQKSLQRSKALNVVEIAMPEHQLFRQKHGLETFSTVYRAAPGRVIFVNSGSGMYQKATALLDEMLEGFVRIAGSVEEGLYQLLRAEESD